MKEIQEAASLVQEQAHEDANIIFGASIDETLGENVKVTVIATGFDSAEKEAHAADSIQVPRMTLAPQTIQSAQPRPAVQHYVSREVPARPRARASAASPPRPRRSRRGGPRTCKRPGGTSARSPSAALRRASPRARPRLRPTRSRASTATGTSPLSSASSADSLATPRSLTPPSFPPRTGAFFVRIAMPRIITKPWIGPPSRARCRVVSSEGSRADRSSDLQRRSLSPVKSLTASPLGGRDGECRCPTPAPTMTPPAPTRVTRTRCERRRGFVSSPGGRAADALARVR